MEQPLAPSAAIRFPTIRRGESSSIAPDQPSRLVITLWVGEGQVTYIAQNGVQVSCGAGGGVTDNSVSGHQYTGMNNASSAGILIFGGCGSPLTVNVSVKHNTLTNNDVGIYLFNDADPLCVTLSAPSTETKNSAVNNTITNSVVSNVSGDGYPCGCQAGISDLSNDVLLAGNKISGLGCTPARCGVAGSTTDVFWIDTTGSTGTRPHKLTTPF